MPVDKKPTGAGMGWNQTRRSLEEAPEADGCHLHASLQVVCAAFAIDRH